MCQELKTEIFVNSIGFLHEESPDPFDCRQDRSLTCKLIYNDQKTEDRRLAGQARRAAMFQLLLFCLIIWSCLGINCIDVSTCLNSKEIKDNF